MEVGANASTSRVWIEDSELSGQGVCDVLGGGPVNSTNSHVNEVYVLNNNITQDCRIGTYCNAFDIVAENIFTVSGNHFYGIVEPGFEQFPHTDVIFDGNHIYPALGRTTTELRFDTTDNATAASSMLTVTGNNIASGTIEFLGTSTALMKNITVTGNNVSVGALEDGITFRFAQQGTVSGNTVVSANGGNCISFATSTDFAVGTNQMTGCNYGIYMNASSTDISIGINSYKNILNYNVYGIYPTPQTVIYKNNAANQTAEFGFIDTTCGFCQVDQSAGKFYFSDWQDTLGLYRGVPGLNGNIKYEVTANQLTVGDWGLRGKSLGVFTGPNLVFLTASNTSWINTGFNFGIGWSNNNVWNDWSGSNSGQFSTC